MPPAKRYATPEEIRIARARAGVSQRAAAEIVGVDEATLQRWEYGQTKKIHRFHLEKLRALPAKKK